MSSRGPEQNYDETDGTFYFLWCVIVLCQPAPEWWCLWYVMLCCLISNTRLSPHNYYANLCVKHQQVARFDHIIGGCCCCWCWSGDRTGFPLYYLWPGVTPLHSIALSLSLSLAWQQDRPGGREGAGRETGKEGRREGGRGGRREVVRC